MFMGNTALLAIDSGDRDRVLRSRVDETTRSCQCEWAIDLRIRTVAVDFGET